jgi:hypothetical protein
VAAPLLIGAAPIALKLLELLMAYINGRIQLTFPEVKQLDQMVADFIAAGGDPSPVVVAAVNAFLGTQQAKFHAPLVPSFPA